jgi:hypothetical protein
MPIFFVYLRFQQINKKHKIYNCKLIFILLFRFQIKQKNFSKNGKAKED